MTGQVSNEADIHRWINDYRSLSLAKKFSKGDRCFVLTLMENMHGWPDHAGHWFHTFPGGGGGSIQWNDMVENNMSSIMQKGGRGSKGMFMVEASIEKVAASARAKLDLLQEGASASHGDGSTRSEYEYEVKVFKPDGDDGFMGTLSATVHESLLFADLPVGWNQPKEIYMMNYAIGGGPSTKQLQFQAYIPERGVLCEHVRETPCDHCGKLGKLMCMPCRARGKQVWYCDASCQKSSWILHKVYCVGCVLCGARNTETKCLKCSSPYCSAACLERDWPQHKHLCRPTKRGAR